MKYERRLQEVDLEAKARLVQEAERQQRAAAEALEARREAAISAEGVQEKLRAAAEAAEARLRAALAEQAEKVARDCVSRSEHAAALAQTKADCQDQIRVAQREAALQRDKANFLQEQLSKGSDAEQRAAAAEQRLAAARTQNSAALARARAELAQRTAALRQQLSALRSAAAVDLERMSGLFAKEMESLLWRQREAYATARKDAEAELTRLRAQVASMDGSTVLLLREEVSRLKSEVRMCHLGCSLAALSAIEGCVVPLPCLPLPRGVFVCADTRTVSASPLLLLRFPPACDDAGQPGVVEGAALLCPHTCVLICISVLSRCRERGGELSMPMPFLARPSLAPPLPRRTRATASPRRRSSWRRWRWTGRSWRRCWRQSWTYPRRCTRRCRATAAWRRRFPSCAP